MTENAVEDEHGSEAYDPDLYVPTGEAEPVNGLEHVGDAEIERFKAQGFLAVEGAFSDAQMADAIKAVEDLIDGKNQGFRGVQFERGVRINWRALRMASDRHWCASCSSGSASMPA